MQIFKLQDAQEKNFVRVEFTPPEARETTGDIDTWNFNLDEERTPSWFDDDQKNDCLKQLRSIIGSHIVSDEREMLVDGPWVLIGSAKASSILGGRIALMLDTSSVGKMLGTSSVGKMLDTSSVGKMLGTSSVGEMLDTSSVALMLDTSSVGEMLDTSSVGKMLDTSSVGEMWGTSSVALMLDTSSVGKMLGTSSVGEMWGTSSVGKMLDTSSVGEMWGTSRSPREPRFDLRVKETAKA